MGNSILFILFGFASAAIISFWMWVAIEHVSKYIKED